MNTTEIRGKMKALDEFLAEQRKSKDDIPKAMVIGHRLASYRVRLGMTQTQLARLAGIQQADISRYERGVVEPSITRYEHLLDVMGVTRTESIGPHEFSTAAG